MLWGAHIAGIPVEETALSFGPVLLVVGSVAGARIRELVRRRTKVDRLVGRGRQGE